MGFKSAWYLGKGAFYLNPSHDALRSLFSGYKTQALKRDSNLNNNNNIFYLNTVGFKANIAYGAV